jgi:uncharacterized RDD family membrane protein YckC
MPEKLAERLTRKSPFAACPYCGTENEKTARFCKKCGRVQHDKESKQIIACGNHPNRRATTTCAQCGVRLCDQCAVDTGGLAFCRACADVDEPTEAERLKTVEVVDLKRASRVGLATRTTAAAVDWFILAGEALILAALFWLVTGVLPLANLMDGHTPVEAWVYWALIGVSVACYFVIFTAAGGQTLGKQAMSITVVREDGTAPVLRDAWVGFVGSLISFCVFGVGYLASLSDPERQAWHDHWAHTLVVSLD